jgi:hypothetical protein
MYKVVCNYKHNLKNRLMAVNSIINKVRIQSDHLILIIIDMTKFALEQ